MISKLVLLSLLAASSNASSGSGDGHECDGDMPVQMLTMHAHQAGTCGDLKDAYKQSECCDHREKQTNLMLVPMNPHKSHTPNICEGKKLVGPPFDNKPCFVDNVLNAMEQAGTVVTKGYQGTLKSESSGPITEPYFKAGLCPVNVHWHLGTEHYSAGEYDEHGNGPDKHICGVDSHDRRLSHKGRRLSGAEARRGFQCHHYNTDDPMFTKPYKWHHCGDMFVGETYEIHWPHSTVGACNTPNQYQTPFYDGVFCNPDGANLGEVDTAKNIGVQAQVFTIVNDEAYYFPDLMRGMIVDGEYGVDLAKYTGSTTGTSRNNEVCSGYAPITWQVDRKCHLISASSFDKMCADMKSQKDDMTEDIYPHGARELVLDSLASDNHVSR